MLAQTGYRPVVQPFLPADVAPVARSVQQFEDEPFGGLPTLAYARLFERAREDGVYVLLDGQGMDEQWAGYDYYQCAVRGGEAAMVQATSQRTCRPECLMPEFGKLAEPLDALKPFPDTLRNLQYRDIRYTKIPRSLRFNDRASMRSSAELREPFLDHRLVELAMRQPVEHKLVNGTRKWMLRHIASRLLPSGVVEAPKRPLQTPQREWLRGECREWANECIECGLNAAGGEWLDAAQVRSAWREYQLGNCDNSFFIWQWISLGLMHEALAHRN